MGKWLGMLEPETVEDPEPSKPAKARYTKMVACAHCGLVDHPVVGLQEEMIRSWLDYIEEPDSVLIEGVLEQCRDSLEACAYFLHRAEEVPKSMSSRIEDIA